MIPLLFGFSPCPNDTFLFSPLVHKLIDTTPFLFSERLADIDTLNSLALAGEPDLCKVSCYAYGHIRDRYVLLRAGGAMGRGCGPLLVARSGVEVGSLHGKPVAVPGSLTTASLLLQLYAPSLTELVFLPFHRIMSAVSSGEVAAGILIHESRFTYAEHGLQLVVDLGAWWEQVTGLPLPLGGIAVRRSFEPAVRVALNRIMLNSVIHARIHPDQSLPYVRHHAQETADTICASHIALYVNKYSQDPGEDGELALETLLHRAQARGLVPPDSGHHAAYHQDPLFTKQYQ